MAALLLAACSAGGERAPLTASPDLAVGPLPPIVAAPARQITLIRSLTCSCCAGHEAHLMRAGFDVSSHLTGAYTSVKDAHLIPADMRSCHTSLVGRYFVEGHVPVAAIEQLLRDGPDIDGIALPGMPPGSPGMGGVADGPLTIYAISDGSVVGEFGRFEAPLER